MNHPEQDDLILFYYGEAPEGVDQHVKDCAVCQAELQTLQRVLNTVDSHPVPEPGADFEGRLWGAVRPRLNSPAPRQGSSWQILAIAASMLLMVGAAFIMGRSARVDSMPIMTASTEEMQRQLLALAVGDHLSRSEAVLTELLNTRDAGSLNIAEDQRRVEDLLSANRIFRQTATHAGDVGTEAILEDLEHVLLEIAHSPTILKTAEWHDLRQGIMDRGILFKVRVFESQMQRREAAAL
jgi:hypothetical protein